MTIHMSNVYGQTVKAAAERVPADWPTAGIADARAYRIDDGSAVHAPALFTSRRVVSQCGVTAFACEISEGEKRAEWANSLITCPACLDHRGRPMIVATYADGFGIWHAEITQAGTGDSVAAQRVARRVIMAELLDRSPRGSTARDIHIRVTHDHSDSRDGVITHYYRETAVTS